eukprot:m.100773 g.100773  ORF g.100773 m.100773 type:complete len:656 (+) comp10360_c0_seq2:277-2244(+)
MASLDDKYRKSGGRGGGLGSTASPGFIESLGQIETKGGMARASFSLGLAAGAAGLVVWLLFSLSTLSHQAEKNEAALVELEKGVEHLSGKLDMALSRLNQVGFGAASQGNGGGAGGAAHHAAQHDVLVEELRRVSHGLDTLRHDVRQAGGGGGGDAAATCERLFEKACSGGGGIDAASQRHDRVRGERDIGPAARLPDEPKDPYASEALSQQTIKMNPGDPLPFVGRDYHPWFSNADHSHHTTYVHLLKDKYGAKRECKYIDVLFWDKQAERCALIVPDREIRSRTVTAELDPKTGKAKPRPVLKRNTNPLDIRVRDDRFYAFSKAKDEMAQYLRVLLGTSERAARMRVQENPEPIVVMVANDGHLGLLFNWACSLRASGIDMPKHVVFVTSASTRDFLRDMGFLAYYHTKLGTYPQHASAKYSDMAFGQMMLLKQIAVSLALESGYDVLFQDIDITWTKNPLPELLEASKYYEVQFQDDGARNARYQPWYANTGFFYMRSTFVARDFWDRVTQQMPSYPQSNQVVLNWVMEGFESRGHPVSQEELAVRILPQDEYVSGNGVDLPGARNPGQATVHQTVRPLSPTVKVVHFCWTHNITYKIDKMKGYKSLYVTEACIHDWKSCLPEAARGWEDDVCQHTDLPPKASSYEAWLKKH